MREGEREREVGERTSVIILNQHTDKRRKNRRITRCIRPPPPRAHAKEGGLLTLNVVHGLGEVYSKVDCFDAFDGEALLDHPLCHLNHPEQALVLPYALHVTRVLRERTCVKHSVAWCCWQQAEGVFC